MYTNYNYPVSADQAILALTKDKNLAKNEIDFVLKKADSIKANKDPNSLLTSTADWIEMITNTLSSCFVSNSKLLEYQKSIVNLFSTLRGSQDSYSASAWQPNYAQELQMKMLERSKNAVYVIDGIINIVSDMKKSVDIADEPIAPLVGNIQEMVSQSRNKTITSGKEHKKIFIVHGHDNEMKESVARFIEKIGY